MDYAIRSCDQLLALLDEIEQSTQINDSHRAALNQDRESILRLLATLKESKDQIREVWSSANSLSHSFGGYVGGDEGKQLYLKFDEVLQALLDLL